MLRMAKAELRPTVSTSSDDSVDDLLLSPNTYIVYRNVPESWSVERQVKDAIEASYALSPRDVARRLQNLVKMRLVERRGSETGPIRVEIRRVGK